MPVSTNSSGNARSNTRRVVYSHSNSKPRPMSAVQSHKQKKYNNTRSKSNTRNKSNTHKMVEVAYRKYGNKTVWRIPNHTTDLRKGEKVGHRRVYTSKGKKRIANAFLK